ncbi:AraC family transcriptional regulator [Terrimonas sp. NA20]|uniref:AraC family transcriptional regulator n=1 Tax=Terrimonas ginsenosidimutans TaxID=2908004 RepID=A0ABS9KN18_9BACT|nr:AraC family transcriptional regulator [Terrimonas ginsenosidimutans]MCG2613680.1 AraC family transcriptional regulator [Terrimonas ginsenosidimutans]
MKPHFHKITTPPQNSFSIRHDRQPNFGRVWHFHPELELHYTIQGEGVRFIGDNVSNFSDGELILVGENLPHTWRCHDKYYQHKDDLYVEAIVLQFRPDCLGKELFGLPEAYLIPQLFERAKKGMNIRGIAKEKIVHFMQQSVQAGNLERIILLLQILKTLAETNEYSPIASAHAFYKSNESETLRLNKICTYTLSNYKKEITLEEIAGLSNLSVTSFCRYFKMMTRKTYLDFLVEIRVSHACRMLVEDNYPIGIVCFECGFNNLSNFYRHFKKVTGMKPFEYKKKYLRESAA